MTTPSQPSLNVQDCFQLQKLKDGNSATEATGGSSLGQRQSSTNSEPDKLNIDCESHEPQGVSERPDSSLSMCSDKFKSSSSHYSSDDSYLPGAGEDCAALLLTCLYCRFHEFLALVPGACLRAVRRCFPSYKYIIASGEMDEQSLDCCGHQLELDCNFNSCQDPAELVELAMEISEVCYR